MRDQPYNLDTLEKLEHWFQENSIWSFQLSEIPEKGEIYELLGILRIVRNNIYDILLEPGHPGIDGFFTWIGMITAGGGWMMGEPISASIGFIVTGATYFKDRRTKLKRQKLREMARQIENYARFLVHHLEKGA